MAIFHKTLQYHEAYAWSAGKDSLVLGEICEKAGIDQSVLVRCNLEYPAFIAWIEQNKPSGLEIINTGQDMEWLKKHPDMLFPDKSNKAAQWFHIVQHRGQARYYKEHQLEAFYGGAVKLIAVRVGNGGTVGSASLACATGKAKLSTKYPSGAKFTATIREKLGDSSKKECIVYLDGSEFEKVTFAAGAEEATALKEAFASSKNFVVDITDASGAVTAVSQSAFADGADPTVTNADYSAGLKEVEKYYFNTICVDTEDAAVHALVAAFLDRIYLAGSFGMAIVTPKPSSSLEDRMTSISSFDTENVIAPLNANANAGNEELKGYQVAAYIAGVVAATPANQSVTHATLSRYSVLNEILTNTEMEVAEEKGCLVLSTASDGAVWLDNGVNTLVHPDANHDSGWKKIRRTKTRYELLNRANAAADALVGKVDNDTNGRATIMAAIQGICNAMEAEGKIQYGNVTESTTVTTDGDTCGFDIEVIDLDSAEHIYLNYYFQFSTIVAASGE